MKSALFLRFTFTMSLYYISYAIMLGFAALFMQHRGFSNTEIGIFFALSATCCIALQIFTGSFLDSHPERSVKALTLLSGVITATAGVLLFFADGKPFIFLCYTVINSLMLLNSSLYNSFGMEYINAGVELNYALSRGICSFLYALTSLVMGVVISRFSIMSIFPAFFIAQAVMLILMAGLKPAKKNIPPAPSAPSSAPDGKTASQNGSFITFFRKNPKILFLLVSILLIYISYTSVNNFHVNIIESVGGGSGELGFSMSLAAFLELPAMILFTPLSRRFSYRSLLCISCIFFFVKIFSLAFAGSIPGVYLSQCLQFCSYALFIPSSAYYINSILPLSDKTKGQAALGIFTFGLSGLISSLLSGIMLDHFGVRNLLFLESGLALIGLAGVLAACHMLAQPKKQA